MHDAIVIGGGVVGASTAYHLARDGAETLLIDRGDPDRATAAGAGVLSPATSSRTNERLVDFAIEAVDYYPELVSELDGEAGYARSGTLAVAVSADEIDAFDEAEARIEHRRERLGIPDPDSIETLAPEKARERFPPLAETHRALAYEDGARVDGRKLARVLRETGERSGLTIETASAERIEPGDPVAVETAAGERYTAESVVIAGGAWSSAFSDQLGIEIPVEPQRGQIVHLDTDRETGEWPVVTAFRGHYIVPWSGGRVAVGATRETGSGFDSRTTAGGVHEVLEEALRVAPGLADAPIAEIRVGLRPTSPDGLPMLGPSGAEGVYLATGHGATGLQLGPYSGKLIGEMARGIEPETDLAAFNPARF